MRPPNMTRNCSDAQTLDAADLPRHGGSFDLPLGTAIASHVGNRRYRRVRLRQRVGSALHDPRLSSLTADGRWTPSPTPKHAVRSLDLRNRWIQTGGESAAASLITAINTLPVFCCVST